MKDESRKSSTQTLGEIGLDNFATYLMNRIAARYNAQMSEEISNLGLNTLKMRALAAWLHEADSRRRSRARLAAAA